MCVYIFSPKDIQAPWVEYVAMGCSTKANGVAHAVVLQYVIALLLLSLYCWFILAGKLVLVSSVVVVVVVVVVAVAVAVVVVVVVVVAACCSFRLCTVRCGRVLRRVAVLFFVNDMS